MKFLWDFFGLLLLGLVLGTVLAIPFFVGVFVASMYRGLTIRKSAVEAGKAAAQVIEQVSSQIS